MFTTSIRWLGLSMGALLAAITNYTCLFGIFDPNYQRPLTFAACVAVVVFVKPLVVRYPGRGRLLQLLLWAIDIALLGLIFLAVQRFLGSAANMQNMLVDYSRADQLIALGGLLAVIELTRREFGLGLSLFAAA